MSTAVKICLALSLLGLFACDKRKEDCDLLGDEDSNGLSDCVDSTCKELPACVRPPEESCSNLIDEDADGLFDCQDPSACGASPACVPGSTFLGGSCQQPSDCSTTEAPFCFSEETFGFPGGACSAFCDLEQAECEGGEHCIDVGIDPGLCVKACGVDADCGRPGYICKNIGVGNTGLEQSICFPSCTQDTQCAPGNKCDQNTGLCQPIEDCQNLIDDDNDELIDCEDINDCPQGPDCPLDAFCAQAAIALEGENVGDTAAGTNAFAGSCIGAGTPEVLFTFTPGVLDQEGFLSIRLFSNEADQGVYVRRDCLDSDSELGCVDRLAAGNTEQLELSVEGGVPLTLFVDTFLSPGDTGTFFLTLSFTPN
jgi:hypothetical protein